MNLEREHGDVSASSSRVKVYAMSRIRKCRRIGCNNPVQPSEGRGRPQKYCRHACKISAYRRRHRRVKLARSGNATHNNDDEWYTPPAIIELCRDAMGGIDLDPASHDVANRCVKATRYFTAADDGLSQPWSGRVFLNPPYSKSRWQSGVYRQARGVVRRGGRDSRDRGPVLRFLSVLV